MVTSGQRNFSKSNSSPSAEQPELVMLRKTFFTFISFMSSMLTLGTRALSETRRRSSARRVFTVFPVFPVFPVFTAFPWGGGALTLLGLRRVALGGAGGGGRVGAGLRRHAGLHRVSSTFALLVALGAPAGDVGDVVLRGGGGNRAAVL
ncbi:hypothetical protein EYF80_018322 [Liparis tanakae]|uniref:Uncharacterized protein n=1 Tax=Liparis tanakae TaxID=230148 RepID=A0A4Z2I0R7_9TELE|nr:hypothetical protein EYF80_018322 [Liparis tanakae]